MSPAGHAQAVLASSAAEVSRRVTVTRTPLDSTSKSVPMV